MTKYYESVVINGKNWFICQYNDCEQTELQEKQMVSHVSSHLINEQLDNNRKNNTRRSDRIIKKKNTANHICECIGCYEQFKYLKSFQHYKKKHSVQKRLQKTRTDGQKSGSSEEAFNLNFRNENCNLNSFNCNESNDNKQILIDNRRDVTSCLNDLEICSKTSTNCSIEPNDKKQVLIDNGESHLRMDSKGLQNFIKFCPKSKPDGKCVESKVALNDGIKVSKNENSIIVSCKGLANASKVKGYFKTKFIKGDKMYFCNQCEYRTRRSPNIAEHINIKHIGIKFKCDYPNCSKVFRRPNSYREHKKNHICGFGIYGDERNVIEVCRKENLTKHFEKIIVDQKYSYRCKHCGIVLRHSFTMKRHTHNRHICPHRINVKVDQNQNVVNEKRSEHFVSGSVATIRTVSADKIFACERYECNAKFAVYSDLLKHQKFLCGSRKVSKTSNSVQNIVNKSNNRELKAQKTKGYRNRSTFGPQNKRNSKGTKSNEKIERKNAGNKINKIHDEYYTLLSPKGAENKTIVDAYYETKSDNGVDYHLCKWNECEFKTKFSYRILAHIQTKHFGVNSRSNDSIEEMSTRKTKSKRKCFSIKSENTTSNQNVDTNKKIKVQVDEKSNGSIEKETKLLNKDLLNIDKMKEFIIIKSTDCEPIYFCKWKDCKHYTNSFNEMTRHIRQTHVYLKNSQQSNHQK